MKEYTRVIFYKWTLRFGKTALTVALFCLAFNSSFAQTSTSETFGQNRVQYKDFIFSYYESPNFTTYFYQGGQDIAKFAIKTAEDDVEEISKMLDVRYKGKIDLIVYNTIEELNQTNIGIYQTPDPGLTLKIPEGKIFVYFNGDHRNLAKQIREGIANLLVNKTVRGNGFTQVVQNAILPNLPDWYRLGLVQYISESWTTDMEDRLRDGILSGRFKKLNKLQPQDAIFVGHSIWHYIDEVHGKSALNNILYLTRVNRSVDNGFLFVLGTNLSETLKAWYSYYTTRFTNEAKISYMPPDSTVVKTKIKKGFDYYQPHLSPDGKYVAYASNDMGRIRVHLLNTETHKKAKVILRGGFRTNTIFTDESAPLIAWDPAGNRLAMLKVKRAETRLYLYDVLKNKMVMNPVRKFQKVVSMNFVDSKQLVLSAVQNGQSDIYLYTIASTTYKKLTDDFYDDLYPAYIKLDSIRGIMFSSNREDDTLHTVRYTSQSMQRQLDLYFYDLDANQNVLYRVTNTPDADEIYPQQLTDSTYCFLSDANGVRNRYVGHFESVFDHNQKTYRFVSKETSEEDSVEVRMEVPLDSAIDRKEVVFKDSSVEKVYRIAGVSNSYTNYTHSILEQSVVPGKGLALDMFRVKNKLQFRKYDFLSASTGKAPEMDYVLQRERLKNAPGNNTNVVKPAPAAPPKNLTQYYDSLQASRGKHPYDFQSDFDYGTKLFDWDSVAAAHQGEAALMGEGGYIFHPSKVRPYFVRFMVDKVVTQLDNEPIVTMYQPFNGSYYTTPLPQFGLKVGITDLLENYKIYGGIVIPFSGGFQDLGYFLCYENLKKRLDKKFTFYRASQTSNLGYSQLFPGNQSDSTATYADKITLLEEQLRYPLDVLNSFRFTFAFRNDKYQVKAVDPTTLNYPDSTDNWLSVRAEYVFDNCMEVMPDIRYGTRFKVFAEVYKEFPTQSAQISDNLSLPKPVFNNKVMFNMGFDLRHYIKVYRQIIWANRLAGAASFGTSKMIYYLGGLDNWITGPNANKFDYNTPIDYNHGYAFQTVATPLRGFEQNARNGDKYVLLNSELRAPIFAALSNSPIKSDFIRNMELVAFFDAGTAWEGLSPFSYSSLFSREIPNSTESPTVVVDLNQYKSPIIFGFGPGIRTTFLGFFIRVDVAWGWDTGVVNSKPMGYFSMDYDF